MTQRALLILLGLSLSPIQWASCSEIGDWKQRNWRFIGSPPPFQRFPQFVLGGRPPERGYRQLSDCITDFQARERKFNTSNWNEVLPAQLFPIKIEGISLTQETI